MIDITGLREDKRPQSSTIVHALLDRIEAAESDAAQQKALADSALRVAEGWEEKCNALRAKIEQMEQQEPVAWAATDETCRIVEALSFNQSRRFDTPLYALPGAQTQPAPSIPDGVIDRLAALPARITPEQAPAGVRDYCHEAAEGYADGWNACMRAINEETK